jgi:hypothetical protein
MTTTGDVEQDLDAELADALADAVEVVGRLQHAFGWCRVLLSPGREPRPAPPVLSDAARRRAADLARAEASDRRELLAAGLPAGAASPAPLDVRLLDVQQWTVDRVARLVSRVARAGHLRLRLRVADPAGVVAALDWLVGLSPRWVVSPAGEVYRWAGVLGDVGKPGVVVEVVDELRELAEYVRQAVGILTDRMVPWPGGRCPACRLRTLQIDATLADPRHWTVRCISDDCRCGPGCTCRQRVRYEGRPHGWSYAELDGPFGLRPAIAAAASGGRRAVRSGVEGYGDRA